MNSGLLYMWKLLLSGKWVKLIAFFCYQQAGLLKEDKSEEHCKCTLKHSCSRSIHWLCLLCKTVNWKDLRKYLLSSKNKANSEKEKRTT